MIFKNDILSHERFGFITGSRVSVLFPKKSAEVGQRTYAKQLANEKYFQYYDEISTWQTEHGNMNEHHAATHYEKYFGDLLADVDFIGDAVNQIGGTPDRISAEYGVDFKCPTTLENWLEYVHENISEQQYHQCQMYMHLTGFDKWYIAAYLTETLRMIDNQLEYPVAEKDRMVRVEVKKEAGWSELLLQRAPVVIEWRDQYFNKLQEHFNGN